MVKDRVRFRIPLLRGWSLNLNLSRNHESNRHGPDTTPLRSTWLMVPLGRGYLTRVTWGRRLWFYFKDNSCWFVEAYLWNGEQI